MTAPQEPEEAQTTEPPPPPDHTLADVHGTQETTSVTHPDAADTRATQAHGGEHEEALAEAHQQVSDLEAALQRERADFLNYRRRATQEREDIGQVARIGVVRTLLPMLDDLELALRQTPASGTGEPWVEGYRLVARKLMRALEQAGITRIDAAGKPFNPHEHEAIGQRPPMQPGERAGTVGEVVRPGYRLHDLILRPAQVVVVGEDRNHDGENGGT